MLSSAECEIFYAYEYENANNGWHFHIYWQRKVHAQCEIFNTYEYENANSWHFHIYQQRKIHAQVS